MKRILSLTLSLLMLMSMATIVGAATDSNVVWQEDFNDGVTVGEAVGASPQTVALGEDGVMRFYEEDNGRILGNASTEITFPEGAYGKGNHEKSLLMKFPTYTGSSVIMYFEAAFPAELPIAEAKTGHIGFDWINFSTGNNDGGSRAVNLKVKFVNDEEQEQEAYVTVGTLSSRIFTHVDGTKVNGGLASWNRCSLYVQNTTVKVSAFSGDTWHPVTITPPEGYTPVAVTGIQISVGYARLSQEHLYGLDNFIAEKVDAMPTDATSSGEGHPVFIPFMDLTWHTNNNTTLHDKSWSALAKDAALSFLSPHVDGSSLPAGTAAVLHSSSYLTFVSGNWNHLSDHEIIFENAEGYYITDATDRATVMGDSKYTMTDGLNLGGHTGLVAGDKIHYGYKFKYTGTEHGSNHILMALVSEASGVTSTLMRMKSDGTLVNAAGDALTKLIENTYYNVDILYTQGDVNTYTTADIYVNGKKIDSVNMYKYDINRIQKMAVTFYGEPKGEATEKTFGDVTTSAVEYYAHGLHIDDVYINNVKAMGAFNKTPYVAYDLNKSLSEASDNIAKYGIVLDPGSMTASRVSNDFTAASFLAAVNLPNVSVVDAEGNALTGDEALVGNKIKITGEFGAPVYYTAVATGANIADTDFVLEATQNGALLGATCAAGSAVTVKAVDDNYATPQIFVAEYETVNGKLNLVSCKGGTGSASLTPSAAGNTVKVFVVSTMGGLQPLYNTNLTFTVQ